MGEYAFINPLVGPSVLVLHSEVGSVMWFVSQCSSWAVPVCHATALNIRTGSALVLETTSPGIHHV